MQAKVERRSLFWYIILRLIAVTSLLVSAVVIQFSTSAFIPIMPFYYLVLAVYGLSLIHLGLYLWGKHLVVQGYLQVVFDLLLITALVYISGGLNGSAYFLYVFAVIAASLVLSERAAYLTAALSAILFGLMVDGLYFGLISYFSPEQYRELSLGGVLFTIFIAWSVFFVIAFLVNHLAGNLRRTKEALRLARKELEVKERLAEAGKIAAQLAHEIRNPLAAISGSAQFLKKELALDEEQKNLMTIIFKESERASRSIEEYLDLAVPEKQVFSMVDLSALLDETLTMLQGSGELGNGLYRLEGNFRRTGIRYYGSPNQFKQVFWNIIKNSLKAMPRGGTLAMDIVRAGREVRLRFSDTGRGMTAEEKDRLFEPFFSGFGNGRGLGMALVRRIVDDYDGRIDVKSEPGAGAEILITLPVKRNSTGIHEAGKR